MADNRFDSEIVTTAEVEIDLEELSCCLTGKYIEDAHLTFEAHMTWKEMPSVEEIDSAVKIYLQQSEDYDPELYDDILDGLKIVESEGPFTFIVQLQSVPIHSAMDEIEILNSVFEKFEEGAYDTQNYLEGHQKIAV